MLIALSLLIANEVVVVVIVVVVVADAYVKMPPDPFDYDCDVVGSIRVGRGNFPMIVSINGIGLCRRNWVMNHIRVHKFGMLIAGGGHRDGFIHPDRWNGMLLLLVVLLVVLVGDIIIIICFGDAFIAVVVMDIRDDSDRVDGGCFVDRRTSCTSGGGGGGGCRDDGMRIRRSIQDGSSERASIIVIIIIIDGFVVVVTDRTAACTR